VGGTDLGEIQAGKIHSRHEGSVPVLAVLLCAKAFIVVSLQREELLEMWLAVVLALKRRIIAKRKDLVAMRAAKTGLVERLVVRCDSLVQIRRLSAHVTNFFRDIHREFAIFTQDTCTGASEHANAHREAQERSVAGVEHTSFLSEKCVKRKNKARVI
jgi:hypothetical protein